MGESVFVQFFGGVGMTFGEIPLIALIRYLFPVGVYLLMAGAYAESRRKYQMLSGYRYGTIWKWWKHQFGRGICQGQLAAFTVMACLLMADILRERGIFSLEMIWKVYVLWLIHIAMLHGWFLLMDLFKIQNFIPAELLLIETLTFLTGLKIQKAAMFMPGVWGMYLRSDWHDRKQGFPALAILLAEVFLTGICYLVGGMILKGISKRNRLENNGKGVLLWQK